MSNLDKAREQHLSQCRKLEKQAKLDTNNTKDESLAGILRKKDEEQSWWIIDAMAPSPLSLEEELQLQELILNLDWLNTKSFMTAAIASKECPMSNFHARWSGEKAKLAGVPYLISHYKLPFRQVDVRQPLKNDGSKYYFFVYDPSSNLPETAVILDDLINAIPNHK